MNDSDKTLSELRTLTFIPVVIIVAVFFFLMFNSIKQLEELHALQKSSKSIKSISQLITDLQQERGLSSGYLGSQGKSFEAELKKVRKRVDADYLAINNSCSKDLLRIRRNIDTLQLAMPESFAYYTKAIKELQMRYLSIIKELNDPALIKQLHTFVDLSFMKEALGEIRGSFNGIFSANATPNRKLLYNIFKARGMYNISLERFYATSPGEFLKQLHKIMISQEYKHIEHILDKYALTDVKSL